MAQRTDRNDMSEIRVELRGIGSKLNDLASNQASLQSDVKSLVEVSRKHESDITRLWESRTQDRATNWPLVAIVITLCGGAFGGLGTIGMFAYGNMQRQVDNLRDDAHESEKRQQRLADAERDRANQMQREMGAVLKVDELFERGKLDLGSNGKE